VVSDTSSLVGATLSCSQGAWAPDLLSEFDYLAPQSFAYGWSENGTQLAAASSSSITASSPGSYTCQVSASNQGGSTAQSSAAVTIAALAPAPAPAPPLIVTPPTPTLSGLSETASVSEWTTDTRVYGGKEEPALAVLRRSRGGSPGR
jgi:hypothetical protein